MSKTNFREHVYRGKLALKLSQPTAGNDWEPFEVNASKRVCVPTGELAHLQQQIHFKAEAVKQRDTEVHSRTDASSTAVHLLPPGGDHM